MRKKKAFTLVELLVVIAIIALLMSILMPVLSRTRRQAKSVICQSNLRQWAIVFSSYTSDYDGYFNAGEGMQNSFEWMTATKQYYQDDKIRFCAEATKIIDPIPVQGSTYGSWGWHDGLVDTDYNGSYGINEFVFHPPLDMDMLWQHSTELQWRRADVKGANKIPLFLDCSWCGGSPNHSDEPPGFPDQPWTDYYVDNMQRFCLNRHDNGIINGTFLDFSVRSIGLKELWKLKWHRFFDSAAGPTPGMWPEWMSNFPEYED